MANFFEAWAGMAKASAVIASKSSGISMIQVNYSGVGVFGIYGGDASGKWLDVKVFRGGSIVADGVKPAVTARIILEDAGEWVRVIQVAGVKDGDEIYGVTKLGQKYTSALTVKGVGKKAADVMQEWADCLRNDSGYKPMQTGLCPVAIPYLALKKGSIAATKLGDEFVGGALSKVHGLSIHTTAGSGVRDSFETAIYGCVQTWENNKRKYGFIASAHFALASNGVIIQIIPTNRQAFSQGNPGDQNWISVEIDNNGIGPMNVLQLESAKRLFEWVCKTYGVPRQLAMGTLFSNKNSVIWKKSQDDITETVCSVGGVQVTTIPMWAAMSRGLSCHYWLDPRNSKPCPGPGIIYQLNSIVKPGSIS